MRKSTIPRAKRRQRTSLLRDLGKVGQDLLVVGEGQVRFR